MNENRHPLPQNRCAWSARLGGAALALGALLAGCGGGGGNDATVDPPPVVAAPVGDPVAHTVGTTGGTVQAVASGVKVSLSFPAGALAGDTPITITPQALAAGDVVRVKVAPAGVFFTQPVTVVLEYPVGQAPSATASLRQQFGSADSYITTTVDATTRTLTAKLSTFGGAALDVLTKPASAQAGRAQALSARALADPVVPADSLIIAQANTPLANMIASIRRQVTIMENVGDFEAAFALQANIASLLNRRGDIDYPVTGTPFIKEAHDTACAALSAAMADAKAAQPKKAAEFKPLREKIGNWWVIADQTNINAVDCPGATIDDFSAAAIDLTQRESALQAVELRKVKEVVDAVKQAKIDEAAAALKIARRNMLEFELLKAAATALALPPLPPQSSDRAHATSARPLAVHDSGYAAIIQTQLLDPLMAPAREAAWLMARSMTSLAQYPVLIDAYGSAPPLQQDVQFVLTRIDARSIDSAGNILASSTLGFEVVPDLPADPRRNDTVTLRPGGTLALSGNIANLECADAGVETLTVTFEGVQVASVSGSGGKLLAGALGTFTPATLLSAAALPADDTGSHTLLIRRSVSPCAAALGLTDDVLATVTLNFGNLCVPAAGFNFCALPVLRSDGSAVDSSTMNWALAISDRAEVLFKRDVSGSQDVGVMLWRTGQVSALPAGFGVVGSYPRLNNQGTVVALYRGGTPRSDGEDHAVVTTNGTPKVLPIPDYPAGMGSFERQILDTPVLGEDGTIIGAALVAGIPDNANLPAGCRASEYCYYSYVLKWVPPYDTYTVLDGPLYTSSYSLISDIALDGRAVGTRWSREVQHAIPYQWNPAAALNGTLYGFASFIDDRGFVLYDEIDQSAGTDILKVIQRPPHLASDELPSLVATSKAGFALICGPSTGNRPTLRHLYDGREWDMSTGALVDPASGFDFSALQQNCNSWGIGGGQMNRQGQFLVTVPRNGVATPVILTPRGVTLP